MRHYRGISSVASTYFHTIIGPSGATINSSTNTIVWANPLTTAGSDGGLAKFGTGILNLTGSNSFTGPITVSTGILEGTLVTSLPSYLTPGHIAVASGATLALAVGGTGQFSTNDISGITTAANFASGASVGVDTTAGGFTYSGNITDTTNGSLGFAKLGTNTLVLAGSNTYTGPTYIGTGGTLNVGSANALGSSGPIIFANGTPYLQFSAASQTDYSTRFTNTPNQAFGIDTNGQNVTFSAALNSAGGYLNKIGAGTLTLSATGNSTIGLQVNNGTLDLTGTYTSTGNAGNYIYVGNGGSNGGISGASGTLIVDTNATLNITGTYSDSFVIGRDSSGGGTLIQNAGSFINFNPGAAINFIVDASGNSACVAAYNINGGTLNLNGNPLIVGLLAGSGTLNVGAGSSIMNAGQLTVATNGDNNAFVNQNGGTITIATAGTLLLANGSGNTGIYNLSGGTLVTSLVTTAGGTSTLNFNGGTLKAAAATTNFINGLTSVNVLAGTGSAIDNGGFAVTIAHALVHGGSSSPDGGMTFQGSGTTTLTGSNTYTGPTTVAAGKLLLTNAASLSSGSILNISSGAMTQITAHTGSTPTVLQIGGLNVSGVFDVTNNDVVVKGAGTAGVTLTMTALAAGYNGGAWNGTSGILSSNAASSAQRLTAVGVATGLSSFEGLTVSSSDELIKYTYYGDANLDGAVDGSDYTLVDFGFNNHLTGWQNGDFNYDGKVDGSDYTLIDNAFNTQGASLGVNPASLFASAASRFSGASSAVPEPASLSALGLAVAGGTLRRRRR
jgi:autotransporter-associated beta strand protein